MTRAAPCYVEFIVAFLPFFIMFLCLWQVAILYWTKLMVDHAAFSAARAAAVIVAEDPNNVGTRVERPTNSPTPAPA